VDALSRDLAGFWLAGAVLAVVGVVSPLEVRYLYALSLPLVIAAGCGVMELWRRGAWGRLLAATLLVTQAAVALRQWIEALLSRYR
jgi:hypothetical protein